MVYTFREADNGASLMHILVLAFWMKFKLSWIEEELLVALQQELPSWDHFLCVETQVQMSLLLVIILKDLDF
jgi:uncharacterized protein (DUF983 family)